MYFSWHVREANLNRCGYIFKVIHSVYFNYSKTINSIYHKNNAFVVDQKRVTQFVREKLPEDSLPLKHH